MSVMLLPLRNRQACALLTQLETGLFATLFARIGLRHPGKSVLKGREY